MKKIKAYSVYYKSTETLPDHCHDVVFAYNANEAKKLAWKHGSCIGYWDRDWLDIRVVRVPWLDWWADFVGFPTVAENILGRDVCFLREAYDYGDEYPRCEDCGKNDLSDNHPDPEARKVLHERWKVCPKCFYCPECGHSNDCSLKYFGGKHS